jgi:site-specific DNA recombinase
MPVTSKALHRGGELRVIATPNSASFEGKPVPSLIKAVARARYWYERITAGEITSIGQLAQESGLTLRYVRRILQCATLSPQITEALLSGDHRPDLTVEELRHSVLPSWAEQEQAIHRLL